MRRAVTLPLAVCIALVLATGAGAGQDGLPPPATPPSPSGPPPVRLLQGVWIQGIAEDQSSMAVQDGQGMVTRIVAGKEFKARLEGFRPDDQVDVGVVQERTAVQADGGTREETRFILQDITAAKIVPWGRWPRAGILLGSALILGLFTLGALRGKAFCLLVGKDRRYSNSKFQIVMWFGIVVTAYIAALWSRWASGGVAFFGGVHIPQNLLLLSGFSAISFAGAKGITASRVAAAEAMGGPAAAARVKPDAKGPRFLTDLAYDDNGNPDIGDFQMLVLTLLAVIVYFVQVFHFLGAIEILQVVTLPDVDTTILATFGLGQGAYLAKKYAGDGA